MRIVVDTNVWVSALLSPSSVPGQVVALAAIHHRQLLTEATFEELAEVLARAKFSRFVTAKSRLAFLAKLAQIAERVATAQPIRACRDPKDDKFLEAAFWGSADCLVTGDGDLLAMHPFRGIRVCTPAQFLAAP